MTDQHHELFEFGAFTLNPREPVLYQAGQPLTLTPKVFELLKLLLESSGQILDKDHLMERLWPDAVVEESSLTQLVFQLRKTLGESGARQQYIETVPRRGYRFIAEVRLTQRSTDEITLTSRTGTHIVIEEEELPQPALPVATAPASRSTPQLRPLKYVWLALAALLVAAAGFGVWRVYRVRQTTTAFTQFHQRKLTVSGKMFQPAVSPDGKWVAYVFEDEDQQGVWVRQADTTERIQVVPFGDQQINGVALSADGQFIFYAARGKGETAHTLYRVPLIGGMPRKVLEDVDSPVTFAPDGQRFAFVRNALDSGDTLLMTARADGTQVQQLAVRKRPNVFLPHGPAWSPDGRTIACGVRQAGPPSTYSHVVTINVADGRETPLGAQTWTSVGQAAWLGDGSGVVVNGWHQAAPVYADQLWLLSWPQGVARQITNDLNSHEGVSLAARANVLVTGRSDRISRIWLMPTGQTSEARPIKAAMSDNYSELFGLDWTPDGKLVYGTHAGGNADIAIMEADGTRQRQLTFHERRETWPVVSADGRYVVFFSSGTEPAHLWRLDMRTSELRQLTNGKGESFPSLSPDGRWVVFSSVETGESNLWKISIDGGTPERLTQKPSGRAAVSPDGKLIACLYRNGAQAPLRVVLLPFNGGEPVKVFEDMPRPDWQNFSWTPDGKALAYIATHGGVSNLWAQPMDGGAPKQLTQFKEDRIFRFAWSRDGKQLALDRGLTLKDILLLNDTR